MDLYIILGVERGATLADVKRAYKRLARKYHPDINPGDRMAAGKFREIAEAYETLMDPDRRRLYDTTGSKGSISRSACRETTPRPSAISSPMCCSARRSATRVSSAASISIKL